MKMLLFKPELGTLKLFNHPEDGDIAALVEDDYFDSCRVVIDGIAYRFFVGDSSALSDKLWSFYQLSNDYCLYGNIVIELDDHYESRDITAEDILRIKSHIVVRNKGYMIYIE